jgi:3'(2'), 5'-bisphosphate nucleotidase
MGSSLKFGVLARGEADVYPRFGPTSEWDTAAGQAILEAAGGSVMTSDGQPLTYGKRDKNFVNPAFIAWRRPPG